MKLFERWRAERSAARQWLLVRPGFNPADPWQWRRLPGAEFGDGPPPSRFAQDSVALIIPAAYCSHFQVPAPPGLKAHEWPLLLEDSLQQPVDQLQVSCLSRTNGHLELLVAERALIRRWLDECEAMGFSPSHLWAEMQLLPNPAPGQLLRWSRDQDACLKRAGANGVQHWLVWPDVLGDLPEDWQHPQGEITGDWPSHWAELSRLPNLLTGSGNRQAKGRLRTPSFSPTQRRLLNSCGLLALVWACVALGQFWQQVPVWKAQVEAVTGPVASARQAERVLARLSADQLDWRTRQQQLVELEQAVERWLDTQPDWGVSGSYFDGQRWRVVLSGSSPAPAIGHWQAMARSAGSKVTVEPDPKTALLTLNFNLDGQP
ncbi:type II secretion system protein GspL [Pseudomonas syringae]|uniref:type II secretion system protein GspL n=1 Tax=Pseudomonas syringae TaxID=317 RepID=UPI00067B637F|nr:type II secretion system protein GspL [Pseudomonas syringae]